MPTDANRPRAVEPGAGQNAVVGVAGRSDHTERLPQPEAIVDQLDATAAAQYERRIELARIASTATANPCRCTCDWCTTGVRTVRLTIPPGGVR